MLKLGLAWITMLTIAGVATTTVACTAAKAAYDCGEICDKYRDCFDADYDVAACSSRCRANADDDAFADKAGACQDCADDATCTGAAFNCANECVGIVP